MKVSGRVLELNCLFLLVVTLLVALQLFLQRAQQQLHVNKRDEGVDNIVGAPVALPLQYSADDALQTIPGSERDGEVVVPEDAMEAAPFVPNIRKSFPKRKAPYVRKGKKKKKARKNKKNKQQKHVTRGAREWEAKNGGEQDGGDKLGNVKKSAGGPRWAGRAGGKLGGQKAGGKLTQNTHIKKKGLTGNENNNKMKPSS